MSWLRRYSYISPCHRLAPLRVAILTMAPEFRPYSALNVELSTLNSCIVPMVGWKVIWLLLGSFRLLPLIMKLTVSSPAPALLIPKNPCPRKGAAMPACCGGGVGTGGRQTT